MRNRVIKFRAFNEALGTMDLDVHLLDRFAEILASKNYTVMQWTGLKDVHGKEIYQHDHVRILYTDWPSNTDPDITLEEYKKSISKHGLVVWDYDAAGWVVSIYSDKYGEYLHSSIQPGRHGEIEVTGHKYLTL